MKVNIFATEEMVFKERGVLSRNINGNFREKR
jgi:hypothetical protein